MVSYVSPILTGAPIFVFLCCYTYSWAFYRRLLGEFTFLVGLEDYVVRGAAVLPVIFIGALLGFSSSAFDLHGLKSKVPLAPGSIKISNIFKGGWISWIATGILAFLFFEALYALIAHGRSSMLAWLTIAVVVGVFIVLARQSYTPRKWLEYGGLIAGSLIFLAASTGFDDAGLALKPRRGQINSCRAGWTTTEGDLLASIGGGVLLRLPNGDFQVRAPENKSVLFLFNSPAHRTDLPDFLVQYVVTHVGVWLSGRGLRGQTESLPGPPSAVPTIPAHRPPATEAVVPSVDNP